MPRAPRRLAWAIGTTCFVIFAMVSIAWAPRAVFVPLPAQATKNVVALDTAAKQVVLTGGQTVGTRVSVDSWLPIAFVLDHTVSVEGTDYVLDLADTSVGPKSGKMLLELPNQGTWSGRVSFRGRELTLDTRGISADSWELESPSKRLHLRLGSAEPSNGPTFIHAIIGPSATVSVVADAGTEVFLLAGSKGPGDTTPEALEPGSWVAGAGTYLGTVGGSQPDVVLDVQKYTRDSIRALRVDEINFVIQP